MKVLTTGSNGLIGSESIRVLGGIGLDNDMRRVFFGPEGSTAQNSFGNTINCDIRDYVQVERLFQAEKFDVVVHCAAQPSHEVSLSDPLLDFSINAEATIRLLEMTRTHCPDAVFIFASTNKVYGDYPNMLPLVELETRYDFVDGHGIDESCPIDQSTHTMFGASKAAADLAVQEYGRTFGLKTVCFRCGCITGRRQSGVPLHGFLNYACRAAKESKEYTIIGYKGKQVRDNLHASDLVAAFAEYIKNPRPGQVYNIGGEKRNSCSILEVVDRLGLKTAYQEKNRLGDHICYYTDMTKFRTDYPAWEPKMTLDDIFEDLIRQSEIPSHP
jgi:CDP-paratose 2-epimerase